MAMNFINRINQNKDEFVNWVGVLDLINFYYLIKSLIYYRKASNKILLKNI